MSKQLLTLMVMQHLSPPILLVLESGNQPNKHQNSISKREAIKQYAVKSFTFSPMDPTLLLHSTGNFESSSRFSYFYLSMCLL